MATPLYDALVAKVRDWSNRDAETLPVSIIQDSLRYAADIAYRDLRVPSVESVVTYTITADEQGGNALTIPDDLSEFISFRRLDNSGVRVDGTGQSEQTIVYDHKADYRTFSNINAQQYSFFRWTRKENQLLVHPALGEGDVYELYYYRRLPALNATYSVNVANQAAGLLTEVTTDTQLADGSLFLLTPTDTMVLPTYFATQAEADTAAMTDPGVVTQRFFDGNEAVHWLRDEQEKILLWGSLVHVFDYLGETEMMQKYLQKFQFEINELNNEEGRRRVTGGNTQQNFDGFLI